MGTQPGSPARGAGLGTMQAFGPGFCVDRRGGGGGWEMEGLLTSQASEDRSLQLL